MSFGLNGQERKQQDGAVRVRAAMLLADGDRDCLIRRYLHYGGQVPQMGREFGSVQLVASVSKSVGSEPISVTHHPDRSWLNADAS